MRKSIYILSLVTVLGIVSAKGQISRVPDFTSINGTVKMIKYYPNPAVTVINFEFLKGYDKSYNFQIYNFVGKKVYELQNVSQKNTINLDQFNRGVYIYHLRDRNGKILEAGKFQVVK
ncbi:MAG TPA: T9SS type A sorting domain-containing protein [Chitinophagaceae bacterium]|nr:T9SS type A sorting domain-containing protein [Chitinophagaceae bacterium]